METVYKVTRLREGRHFSVFSPTELEIEYIPGVVAIPPNGTYLLAFATLEEAREFAWDPDEMLRIVWEADAMVIGPVIRTLLLCPSVSPPGGLSAIERFWQSGDWQKTYPPGYTCTAVRGTVACANIMLDKKVSQKDQILRVIDMR